jgi:Co/Zn/Cd efflux system component
MATSSFADLPTVSAPRVRRALILAVAAAGVVVVLAAALLLRAGGDDHPPARFIAPGHAFSVVLPDGWRALDAAQLRAVPGAPAAVLRRADGSGVVVIRRRSALAGNTRSLTRDLTAQIARRFRDVRPVTARTVKLAGGPAYVYTFARPTAGRVQSLTVAPRAGRTYTLDAVAGAGARDVAAQIGAIVRSFDTTDHAPRS